MKKRLKYTLTILAVLLLAGAALLCWQWENVTALKLSLQYSRDDLSQMMDKNVERVDAVSEALDGVTVRDLTEEEKSALRQGELSRDELIGLLVGKPSLPPSVKPSAAPPKEPSPSPSAEPSETPSAEPSVEPSSEPSPTPSVEPAPAPSVQPSAEPEPAPSAAPSEEDLLRDELARLIAEIYLMKEEYTAWLEAEYQAALEEYAILPPEEQTTAKKYEIGLKHMRIGLAKEDECDAIMAKIEHRIREILIALGGDTGLADEIHAAYVEEKELKKAYFLGLHN